MIPRPNYEGDHVTYFSILRQCWVEEHVLDVSLREQASWPAGERAAHDREVCACLARGPQEGPLSPSGRLSLSGD